MKKLNDIVFKVISNSLNVDNKLINLNTDNKNLKEWDSLGQIRIILNLEKNFTKIKTSDYSNLTSVKKIIGYLKDNGF